MEESRRCPICGMDYVYPTDNIIHEGGAAHRVCHNDFIRRCVFVSKFSSTKELIKQFSSLANPYIIYHLTRLPILEKYPKVDKHMLMPNTGFGEYDKLYFIQQRPYSSYFPLNKNDEILIKLWEEGYMTKQPYNFGRHDRGYIFFLTLKGFQALAGCVECDLICIPDARKDFLFHE